MNAIQWVRNNLVVVISILVVVVSLGVLAWAQMQGSALRAEADEAQRQLNIIRNLQNQTITLPAASADEAPEQVPGRVINAAVRDYISGLYEGIRGEHRKLTQYVLDRNTREKRPLVQGLWDNPDQTLSANPAIRIQARVNYRQALQDMLRPWSEDAAGPRLNAGMPPSSERIQRELADVANSLRMQGSGVEGAVADQRQLFNLQQNQLIEALRDKASRIHLYAVSDIRDPAFPFDVAAWSQAERPAEPAELWEGQLELWIQQDIARAIMEANKVTDPSSSVIQAPVKRLIKVDVWPGYVGLHTAGALVGGTAPQALPYPAPLRGMVNTTTGRQPDNFAVSPTGRVSNALYDVRHVVVEMVADVTKLPRLFEAINDVNLMAVLSVQMENIDEYDALREGFFYGSGDVARVTMVVESIWLREFTASRMPSIVRQYVGIDEPVDLTPAQGQDQMYAPYEDYGQYEQYQ